VSAFRGHFITAVLIFALLAEARIYSTFHQEIKTWQQAQ